MLVALTSIAAAENDLRDGPPKECFLYSYGKGPNWNTKISTEFRRPLLAGHLPVIEQVSPGPEVKALAWTANPQEPEVTTIANVDGREVIQVIYPESGPFGKTIGTVILAIETAADSQWFSPFFAACPELFSGHFVSGRDVTFGYAATLSLSGTGAFRTHYLFDLKKPHPVLLATENAGRVVLNEFKDDEEYQKALKVFDREAALLGGSIPPPD